MTEQSKPKPFPKSNGMFNPKMKDYEAWHTSFVAWLQKKITDAEYEIHNDRDSDCKECIALQRYVDEMKEVLERMGEK